MKCTEEMRGGKGVHSNYFMQIAMGEGETAGESCLVTPGTAALER